MCLLSTLSSCVVDNCLVQTYAIWIGIDLMFVFIAVFLCVFVEPIASGSGMPEVICYLNGIKVKHGMRLKGLLIKIIGGVFAVASGLTVGSEELTVCDYACIRSTCVELRAGVQRRSGCCRYFTGKVDNILIPQLQCV